MLLKPDCIPCILQMTVSALRKLPLGEDEVQELYIEILKIPSLRGQVWDVTSEEVIEYVMEKITNATGDTNPFYSEKLKQNQRILALYPSLKKWVDEDSDPLYVAVNLATIGNAIDFMMSDDTEDTERLIKERLKASVSKENYKEFKEQLNAAKLLLYIGDNAGEIVFDKLLIETIKKHYNPEVTFVVRSVPTLNDATLKEAKFVGLDEVAVVVENGIDGPLPGTFLRRCSKEMRELFDKADLVISKGGGNFDTLDEQKKDLKKDITFMLLSKCYPYHTHFDVPIDEPILENFFVSAERDRSIE